MIADGDAGLARLKNTKDRILDVAEALCAEVGPIGVRHSEIAARVGIRPPSIYAHYPSLEAILAAVSRRGLEATRATYAGLEDIDSPVAALNLAQDRQVDLLVAHPGFTRLVLADLSLPGGSTAIEANMDLVEEINAQDRSLFLRAVDQGEVAMVDPDLWLAQRLGSLYVVLSMEWMTQETLTPQRVAEIKGFLHIAPLTSG